jgi:hypothetical protein
MKEILKIFQDFLSLRSFYFICWNPQSSNPHDQYHVTSQKFL